MRIAGTSLTPLEIWRHDVTVRDARRFMRSLLTSCVRGLRGAQVGDIGRRPRRLLVLYEMETCPYSRLVREALSELDLDVLIKPCPQGERVHRGELESLRGQERIPFLVDHDAGLSLGESSEIVAHLYERYGDGEPPEALQGGLRSRLSSKVASLLRHGPLHYTPPSKRPVRPLELWGYEASPYTRFVRERLGQLAIAHVSRPLARKSPRRASFIKAYGHAQFPRLYDPNTAVGMFESDAILGYLEAHYALGIASLEEAKARGVEGASKRRTNGGHVHPRR